MNTNSTNGQESKNTKDAYLNFSSWASKQQKASIVENALKIAAPRLAFPHTAFDSDPWELNVENGVIDLKTGELLTHSQMFNHTKITHVPYQPREGCRLFLKFMSRILNDDDELIRFTQKAIGYSLTGNVSEQVFFLLYGTGANGKSTLTDIFQRILGGYTCVGAPGLLLEKPFPAHPTELADLFGRRLVTISEVKTDTRWDEERIKALTGGDPISARRMKEDFWSFDPTHKFWISVNHLPESKDTSEGFWRRVRIIPFTTTIPTKERDPNLLAKLHNELPGILAWAVKGCLLWQKEGLTPPKSIIDAIEAYHLESDTILGFIREKCEQGSGFRVQASAIYRAYSEWTSDLGKRPESSAIFSKRLKSLGFETVKISSNFYIGIGLKNENRCR